MGLREILVLAASIALAARSAPSGDGALASDGLLHDSRDPVYRLPSGAVPVGTAVRLRLRARRGDATTVTLATWNETSGARGLHPMNLAGTGRDAAAEHDYWEVRLPAESEPGLVWYRFVVRDGPALLFYEDDAPAEGHEPDGGRGAPFERSPDRGWLITHYAPAFRTPQWLKDAVVYQIFPDRFANGDPANDPSPDWPTVYGQPVQRRPWDARPEGACRYYTGACCSEDPKGRDFFGGDLEGIRRKLPYLADLGVTALYLNPVFESPSNHKYDTRDYTRIDRAFGDAAAFERLAGEASAKGIRILLDGVFNHTSSDSLYFDKLGRYPTLGAYESRESPYRAWFSFDAWPEGYKRWFGVDTLPVLSETEEVKRFLWGEGGVAQRWLERGASGWRLDAMEQKSHGFWRELRAALKRGHPEAALVGEFWHNAAAWLDGREMDAVMNYRLRAALIGFVNGDSVDANARIAGLSPTRFDGVLRSVEEQYPPEAFQALMNVVDSHDTERILWTLTPAPRRPEEKEAPALLEQGIEKLKLLTILQFTLPGAPTVYYGDEVGLTGDTDPDDRRPFPWGHENAALRDHYRQLIGLRRELPCLRTGTWTTLLADDASGVYAYLRRDAACAAVVAVNPLAESRGAVVPVGGVFADGTALGDRLSGASGRVVGGALRLRLPARGGAILVAPAAAARVASVRSERPAGWVSVRPPAPRSPAEPAQASVAPPPGVRVEAVSHACVRLAWDSPASGGVSGYDVLRAEDEGPLRPIDHVMAATTSYVDAAVLRGRRYSYAVRSRNAAGRAGPPSPSRTAVPEPARVPVTLVVAAPDPGDARVHVAGSFQGWVAGSTPLTPAGPGRWSVTLEVREGERLDYKYTLGSWDRVEKGADLEELPWHSVTVVAGADGAQVVEDRVLRWRDADPCLRK